MNSTLRPDTTDRTAFFQYPEAVISDAIISVCSDGNADPKLVAKDVIAALSKAGYRLRSDDCPRCRYYAGIGKMARARKFEMCRFDRVRNRWPVSLRHRGDGTKRAMASRSVSGSEDWGAQDDRERSVPLLPQAAGPSDEPQAGS